jgi:hypothetical protein
MDPKCVNQIGDTILKFEQDHKCYTALAIFDTWSKCLGGCDEQTAQVQNYAAEHIKKIRERDYGSFHCATVGHSGKNLTAGERGSNARRAHVDMAVLVNKGAATVEKANDLADNIVLATFEPEEVTICKWQDGSDREDPYTVSILAPYKPDHPTTETRTEDFPPTGRKGEALAALASLIARSGQNGFVPLDHWKDELRRVGWIKHTDKNDRATFKRLQDGLTQHLIFQGELVAVKPNGKVPPPP